LAQKESQPEPKPFRQNIIYILIAYSPHWIEKKYWQSESNPLTEHHFSN